MIKPTVGRVVLFWRDLERRVDGEQPEAAMVTFVHDDRLVNLVVHSHDGESWGQTHVQLLQDDDAPPARNHFAEWMPWQLGQAKRHEAEAGRVTDLEAELQRTPAKDKTASFKAGENVVE
jgi:hypothetical protein